MILRVFIVVVVMLVANAALACPVCGANKSENDWAFGLTTVLLSLMPPAMFAGIVVFFVRAHRRAAREHQAPAPAPTISTPD